jgi:hypothetical protein
MMVKQSATFDRWLMSRIAVMVMLGAAFAGCHKSGESLQPISGKVTLQGRPITAGVVRIRNPQLGIDMTARLGPDGGYEVMRAQGPGLPEGTYQVAITPLWIGRGRTSMVEPSPRSSEQESEIPARYRQASTSGLTLVVKPGPNQFNIDMRP